MGRLLIIDNIFQMMLINFNPSDKNFGKFWDFTFSNLLGLSNLDYIPNFKLSENQALKERYKVMIHF